MKSESSLVSKQSFRVENWENSSFAYILNIFTASKLLIRKNCCFPNLDPTQVVFFTKPPCASSDGFLATTY
jgi:hypothetical protein